MDHSKKVLIANVINFLNGDAQSGLSDEKKESSEVAAQCLETTYDLTNFVLKDDDKFDLLTLIAEKQSETVITVIYDHIYCLLIRFFYVLDHAIGRTVFEGRGA